MTAMYRLASVTSLKPVTVSGMKEKRRVSKMDAQQVKLWAQDGCVTKTENSM